MLAFIVSLHLLAVLVWLQDKRLRVDQRPTLISILLQPAAKRAAPSPDRPRPSSHRIPVAVSKWKPPELDISPTDAGTDRTDAASDTASPAPANSPEPAFNMELVRRDASRVARTIAREMRNTPPGGDTAWTRFGRDVDAAHSDAGVWQDSYTAPDGTIIYRKHVGGRTVCRMSGSVGPENGIIKGINDAGSISCPARAQWKREP